jgi:hypothetical protein
VDATSEEEREREREREECRPQAKSVGVDKRVGDKGTCKRTRIAVSNKCGRGRRRARKWPEAESEAEPSRRTTSLIEKGIERKVGKSMKRDESSRCSVCLCPI